MATNEELSVAPETPPEADATQPENESAETTQSDTEEIVEIINRFQPDADTSSPEAIIASATQVLQMMVPIYDQTYDLALSAPETASFLHDLLTTGDVAKSIARNYDPEEFQALIEEVGQNDDYEGDRSAHAEKVAKVKARTKQIGDNVQISMQAIDKWAVEHENWDQAKADEFEKFVLQFYQDGVDGLISEQALAVLEKGFTYDGDVAVAEQNGKVIGRNENIVASKLSKEKEEELLPEHLSGKATPPPAPAREKSFAGKFMEGVL